MIGLAEALMEEEGISFEEAGAIDADGVEVVSAEEEAPAENISDIMNSLQEEDDTPLPEIGDDEEDEEEEAEEPVKEEEELESILPAGMQVKEEETPVEEKVAEPTEAVEETPAPVEEAPAPKPVMEKQEAPKPEPVAEKPEVSPAAEQILSQVKPEGATNGGEKLQLKTNKKESDINLIKDRIKELVGEVPSAKPTAQPTKNIQTLEDLDHFLDKPPVVKRNVVKVNRAAIIQQTEAEMEAAEAEAAAETAESAEPETSKTKQNLK